MELLDLLDGHNEEAADDGQGDGGREGEVVAEGHHGGGHDDRAAHLTKGGAHVQNTQILASFFLVRQHVDEQSLIDYKDVALLRKFISDRGKIRSRRITGVSVQEQRELAKAIKNAREMALLPYATSGR